MALIDRLKERVETDMSDVELQAMIDEVTAEIERRYGNNAAITVHKDGGGKVIALDRPVDTAQAITVVEIQPGDHGAAASQTTLAADDYRVLHGGRTLERLIDGTNGRELWADVVKVTYTPVSDQKSRDEVTIKVVQLDLTYRGLDKSESAGDFQRSGLATADAYNRERDALLGQLAPRRGLAMA